MLDEPDQIARARRARDRRHRTWALLTPWERWVRIYLVLQALAIPVGVAFASSGYHIATPNESAGQLAERVNASVQRISTLESRQVTDHALISGLARLVCQQNRTRAELAGLPCGYLIGNRLADQ